MRVVHLFRIITVAMVLGSCQTAAQHAADVRAAEEKGDRLTVGKVQKEIRVGMSGAKVIEVLGSPNVITTDDARREVWVYDKISSESIYTQSSGGVSALIIGGAGVGGGIVGGGGGAGYGSAAGASSMSARTLTVIIKLDENMKVRDFAYRTSRY